LAISESNKTVEIQVCELRNFKGKSLDVLGLVQGFEIFEDMFSSTLYGRITLTDTQDLKQNFPLIGEETVRLKFKTAEEPSFEWIDATFAVITPGTPGESDHSAGATNVLSFISEEMLLNRTQLVSKSFRNMNPGDIVAEVLKDLPSPKTVDAEQTFGIQTYVAPNLHPFEVISSMCSRAKSKEFVDSSGFLFFESLDGFVFKSIDFMISNGTEHKYNFTKTGFSTEVEENRFYSIQNYTLESAPNVLEAINSGMYGNTTHSFNIQDRVYSVIQYNYFDDADYKKTVHLEGSNPELRFQTSQFKYASRTQDSMLKFVPRYSGDQFKDSNISVRYSQVAQILNGFKMNVEINGNSNLRVGDKFVVDIPARLSDDVEKQQRNVFLSGRFLVTSVRHLVEGDKYTCYVELTKDSYAEDHEQFVDELFAKINVKRSA